MDRAYIPAIILTAFAVVVFGAMVLSVVRGEARLTRRDWRVPADSVWHHKTLLTRDGYSIVKVWRGDVEPRTVAPND